MIRTTIVAAALAVSGPVIAEPQPAVAALMQYMDATQACFDAALDSGDAATCVGQGAALCMDNEADGYTTVGMMFCTLAEYEEWDRLLNVAYRQALDDMSHEDSQDAEFFPDFANRVESLRSAQRAWIPLRDADCKLEYDLWGAGSMRQIAGAACLLDLTAKRAIYLRFLGQQAR